MRGGLYSPDLGVSELSHGTRTVVNAVPHRRANAQGIGHLPGVQDADGPGNSFVWVPSLKAVVTGDIVFDHVYFGVARPDARANWQKTIDQIAGLNPAIVIPGHEDPGATGYAFD